jgi:hypothetical protein
LGYAFLFTWLFYVITDLMFGAVWQDMSITDPNTIIFFEWIIFAGASFYFALYRPPLTSRRAWVVFLMCYLFIAIANPLLLFAGGDCLDLYGNFYAGNLHPYQVSALCVPQIISGG